MFNNYTCNVVYGSTGERTMFMGMDLTCDMKVSHALGERPVVDKEITHEKGTHVVSDLLRDEKFIRYDLILRMMMKDGTIDYDTKVKVGYNGRLREVFLVKEKEGYRIFGKTYYGLVTP